MAKAEALLIDLPVYTHFWNDHLLKNELKEMGDSLILIHNSHICSEQISIMRYESEDGELIYWFVAPTSFRGWLSKNTLENFMKLSIRKWYWDCIHKEPWVDAMDGEIKPFKKWWQKFKNK